MPKETRNNPKRSSIEKIEIKKIILFLKNHSKLNDNYKIESNSLSSREKRWFGECAEQYFYLFLYSSDLFDTNLKKYKIDLLFSRDEIKTINRLNKTNSKSNIQPITLFEDRANELAYNDQKKMLLDRVVSKDKSLFRDVNLIEILVRVRIVSTCIRHGFPDDLNFEMLNLISKKIGNILSTMPRIWKNPIKYFKRNALFYPRTKVDLRTDKSVIELKINTIDVSNIAEQVFNYSIQESISFKEIIIVHLSSGKIIRYRFSSKFLAQSKLEDIEGERQKKEFYEKYAPKKIQYMNYLPLSPRQKEIELLLEKMDNVSRKKRKAKKKPNVRKKIKTN